MTRATRETGEGIPKSERLSRRNLLVSSGRNYLYWTKNWTPDYHAPFPKVVEIYTDFDESWLTFLIEIFNFG